MAALLSLALARLTDRQEGFVLIDSHRTILVSGGGNQGDGALDPIANGWLVNDGGVLRAAEPDQQPALEAALTAVLADPAPAPRLPFLLPRAQKAGLLGAAAAFGLPGGARYLLVRIIDPEARRTLSPKDLETWFSLTPAERELAADLLDGAALQQSADRRDRKVLTARTQLKRVFDKTGANRQPLLVQLLTRLTQI